MRWTRTALATVLAAVTASACAAESPAARPSSSAPQPSSAAPAGGGFVVEAAATAWTGSWATAVQDGGRSFTDQTVRQVVHTSIGGDATRLRLSNEYGTTPLTLTGVRIARPAGDHGIVPGTDHAVTFGGRAAVTIPAGATAVSDATTVATAADADVVISLHVSGTTGPSTRHSLATRDNWVAAGDQTAAATLTGAEKVSSWFFLSGLDVVNPAATGAVVAFGASITDGLGSTWGANQRWPDLLADRLRNSGRTVAVLNTGISGNRLTADGNGESALKRFDRDVLRQPGARWVIISDDALNDLGSGDRPDAGVLIGALRELTERAHDAGVRVICSTLTPYRGAGYWTALGEQGRAAVNAYVRGTGSGCDAVLDQDAATHDPQAPARFRAAHDSGDHLHPNQQGMTAIAGAADLNWFG
ncbi:GDSL-type esterase/lipase family protein [Actinoplanes sp. NBRC 101535]|uniref:GDSL-type esterase/lipase family protein n=1 Tax=Actinoplanes sp. NBRC 101535 TaxID=3032196 RepID=UPI0024A00C18|nr:GDSL-type esterase/lipase family protein [Actinoplanes sp. NBRC 101535]GLX99676.1 SGNH hydrolase [Actinoplanes sp. NBRC 101535]